MECVKIALCLLAIIGGLIGMLYLILEKLRKIEKLLRTATFKNTEQEKPDGNHSK
jgi:hypothetical protein